MISSYFKKMFFLLIIVKLIIPMHHSQLIRVCDSNLTVN